MARILYDSYKVTYLMAFKTIKEAQTRCGWTDQQKQIILTKVCYSVLVTYLSVTYVLL